MNPKIDAYLAKSQSWRAEMSALRAILLECGLTEELKWGKPCYTYEGSNVVILFGMKEVCGPGFFKGSLMPDPEGILFRQGENSQAVRLIRFRDVQEIVEMAPVLRAYILNAIEVEKSSEKVDFKEKHALVLPEELTARLGADPALKAAFEALTPGRQRGYNLHFSQPKRAETRKVRIEKCAPRILAGKGMNDR